MSILFQYLDQNNLSFKNYLNSLDYINDENIELMMDFYKQNNYNVVYSNYHSILIKGGVQSGKTNNVIYLINEWINNKNVKYFFYLTGHLNKLNNQNILRLKSAFKYINLNVDFINARNKKIDENWIRNQKRRYPKKILIFTGIKKKKYFKNIIDSINNSSNQLNSIVIIDDEADSYTLSSDFRYLRKKLLVNNNITYVSITATPYKNLYKYQELYDYFSIYKNPPKYTGINEFMNSSNAIMPVDSHNNDNIIRSLIFNAYKSKEDNPQIIWNVSRKTIDHKSEAKKIKYFLSDSKNLDIKIKLKEHGITWDEFWKFCQEVFHNIHISNSIHNYKFDEMGFIIGRENMSRGITYERLVSMYLNMGNKKNYDPGVIMQASRWLGYRNINKMKIFVNHNLYNAYKECLKLEKITNEFKINKNYSKIFDYQKFKYLVIREK